MIYSHDCYNVTMVTCVCLNVFVNMNLMIPVLYMFRWCSWSIQFNQRLRAYHSTGIHTEGSGQCCTWTRIRIGLYTCFFYACKWCNLERSLLFVNILELTDLWGLMQNKMHFKHCLLNTLTSQVFFNIFLYMDTQTKNPVIIYFPPVCHIWSNFCQICSCTKLNLWTGSSIEW